MIPLFSTEQIRKADSFAINHLGMPSIILMENAAIEIFNISNEKFQLLKYPIEHIGFVCGKGNNGGDGFACARHFANNGFGVSVLHLGNEDEMSADALSNYLILRRLSESDLPIGLPADRHGRQAGKNIIIKKYSDKKDIKLLSQCDILFDALLGSGTKGELREPYITIIQKLNELEAFKVAIDNPTGLNTDTGYANEVFKADVTVTLGEFKKGLFFGDGYANAGEIFKGSIGVSNSYFDRYDASEFLIEPEDVFEFLPRKKKSTHKYSTGKVFTIAGSGKLPGAAALTSRASLKVGAGSSILAFPRSVRKLVHKSLTEVIVEAYQDEKKEILSEKNISELKKRIKWADVVAIGPGLGREEDTQSATLKIIKEHNYKRIVIDADAISALGNKNYKSVNLKDAVITPHHGEFSNLIGVETSELKKDLLGLGRTFVKETGSYLVLKGAPTLIFNPADEVFINTTGNPGLAKFGTGDVLTGVLAGFLSQNKNIEEALICGVYLHSLAADLLKKDFTEYGFTATDIINKMPASINFIRKSFD